jgi:hypothetical protein
MGIGLIIRGFFTGILKQLLALAEFCFKYWQYVLPLIIIAILGWKLNTVTGERDTALKALNDYVQSVQVAAAERNAEIKTKERIATETHARTKLVHKQEVDTLEGKINELHTKQAVSDRNIGNLRDRVRLEVARNAAYGVPGMAGPGQEPSQGWGDCDSTALGQAYDNLELACAITTSDYNALRTWADTNCTIFTCKDQGANP